jgi:hypothetical protein
MASRRLVEPLFRRLVQEPFAVDPVVQQEIQSWEPDNEEIGNRRCGDLPVRVEPAVFRGGSAE